MIRRDYILQMIEELMQALTQIRALRQGRRWQEARRAVDAQCEKLAALGARNLARLSETELLARVAQDQPSAAVRPRLFLIIALLQEAADIAVGEERMGEAREIYLKALRLLLEVSAGEEPGGHPAFVPRVEALVHCLANESLPTDTQVLLMRHYESTGQWAKAEDSLFAVLDATTNDPASLEFGAAFYGRMLRQTDAALSAGNLPRAEAEEGLQELQQRKLKAAL
jgi:uncharacterized protein DUF6483